VKNRQAFLLVLLMVCCLVSEGRTQEVLVPLDEEGNLNEVDASLNRELKLFTEYENFHEARLFQINDSTYVLEIFYKPGISMYKDRISLSASEVGEFRKQVSDRIAMNVPRKMLDQEGRTELLVGTLALSLGYYGWAVPAAFGVDDPKVSVALYMLTSGGSFFAPFMVTRNMAITHGQATFGLYGGTRGIAHGVCLGLAAFGEDSAARIPIASGVVMSMAEAIAGFRLAGKANMSAGKAEVIGVGGDFGLGLGLGAAYLADFFEEDDVQFRSIGGSALLGSGLGLIAGSWLSNRQHYTQGDANVLRAAGFLGAYMPLPIVDVTDPENDKAYPAASMAGAVLGLGMGDMLVRGKDFSTGQGRLITFSEFAGGLVGLGCAYLFSSEDGDNNTLFLSASSVGAAAGFFFMYRSFAGDARVDEPGSSLNINFTPEGMLTLAMGGNSKYLTEGHIPIVRVDFRF
jgi:hypothetical protein